MRKMGAVRASMSQITWGGCTEYGKRTGIALKSNETGNCSWHFGDARDGEVPQP